MNDNANAVQNGFYFQEVAAVSLLLDHLDDFEKIKNESDVHDIVIVLQNGSYVLAQAKSSFDEESKNATTYLKMGLKSLENSFSTSSDTELVYITNIKKMFGAKTLTEDFASGYTVNYNQLSQMNQNLVDKYISDSFDVNHLSFQFLYFAGDDELKLSKIKIKMKNAFQEREGLKTLNVSFVLDTWLRYLKQNATNMDRSSFYDRKKMTWGMLVRRLDYVDDDICSDSEQDYSDINYEYGFLIDSLSCRFDITSRIISDYYNNRGQYYGKPDYDAYHLFANDYYESYLDILEEIDRPIIFKKRVLMILIQIVLRRRKLIDSVTKEMRI